jgi:hypothetical protein
MNKRLKKCSKLGHSTLLFTYHSPFKDCLTLFRLSTHCPITILQPLFFNQYPPPLSTHHAPPTTLRHHCPHSPFLTLPHHHPSPSSPAAVWISRMRVFSIDCKDNRRTSTSLRLSSRFCCCCAAYCGPEAYGMGCPEGKKTAAGRSGPLVARILWRSPCAPAGRRRVRDSRP